MLTFDLHYHVNINFSSKTSRNECLKKHKTHLRKVNIDYVASTEHVYKKPLEAYRYLKDTAEDIFTDIIPGVEWISKEGIDIIFLFESEYSLRYGLTYLKPFQRSVWDIRKLQEATNSITIIPHPFTPGRTGAATVLGEEIFSKLLDEVDYIEIHNGLSLIFLNFKLFQNKYVASTHKMKQIQYTFALPPQYKYDHLGWAVGSDAHFPGHQQIVGCIENANSKDNWFELLMNRIHLTPVNISSSKRSGFGSFQSLTSNGKCVMKEALIKFAFRGNTKKNGLFQQIRKRNSEKVC